MDEVQLRWGTAQRLAVDDVQLHVEVAGPDDGPTVLALHGFASGSFTWAGIAPALAHDHRIVAHDRPPFGRSSRPRPPVGSAPDPYAPSVALRHAEAVLDVHSGAQPLVVVGHSAGALLATELVLGGRVPVAGVVLLAPALAGAPPAFARRILGIPGIAPMGAAALRVALLGTRAALARAGQHGTPLLTATGAETARMLRRPGTARALVHLTRTWEPPALLDGLGPLGVPTMVIAGDEDRISPPAQTTEIAERLGAELHLLDAVGHAPQEQVPDTVGPLIAGFVKSVSPEVGR